MYKKEKEDPTLIYNYTMYNKKKLPEIPIGIVERNLDFADKKSSFVAITLMFRHVDIGRIIQL